MTSQIIKTYLATPQMCNCTFLKNSFKAILILHLFANIKKVVIIIEMANHLSIFVDDSVELIWIIFIPGHLT